MNHNVDIQLYFSEPDHKYTDQFNNDYTSSTTLIHHYVPKFEADYWSKKKADERGVTQNAIKNEWKFLTEHACAKGTEKHDSIEQGIKATSMFNKAVKLKTRGDYVEMFTLQSLLANRGIGRINLDEFYEAIGKRYPTIFKSVKHFVSKGYEIYAEIGVSSFKHLVSGMIDCFLIKDNDFIILDWKTNKNEIKFKSGYYRKDKPTGELTDNWVPMSKFLLYPMDNLMDCSGSHYSLQLSLYAYLVELCDMRCVGLFIAHIRDTYELNKWGMPRKDPKTKLYIPVEGAQERIQWHSIRYYKKDIEKMLDHHMTKNNIEQVRLMQKALW